MNIESSSRDDILSGQLSQFRNQPHHYHNFIPCKRNPSAIDPYLGSLLQTPSPKRCSEGSLSPYSDSTASSDSAPLWTRRLPSHCVPSYSPENDTDRHIPVPLASAAVGGKFFLSRRPSSIENDISEVCEYESDSNSDDDEEEGSRALSPLSTATKSSGVSPLDLEIASTNEKGKFMPRSLSSTSDTDRHSSSDLNLRASSSSQLPLPVTRRVASLPSSSRFYLTPKATLRTITPLFHKELSCQEEDGTSSVSKSSEIDNITPNSAVRALLEPALLPSRRLSQDHKLTKGPPQLVPSLSFSLGLIPNGFFSPRSSPQTTVTPPKLRRSISDRAPVFHERTASVPMSPTQHELGFLGELGGDDNLDDSDDDDDGSLFATKMNQIAMEQNDLANYVTPAFPLISKQHFLYTAFMWFTIFFSIIGDSLRLCIFSPLYDSTFGDIAVFLTCFTLLDIIVTTITGTYRSKLSYILDLCSMLSFFPLTLSMYGVMKLNPLLYACIRVARAANMCRVISLVRLGTSYINDLYSANFHHALNWKHSIVNFLSKYWTSYFSENSKIEDEENKGKNEFALPPPRATSANSRASHVEDLLSDYIGYRVVVGVLALFALYVMLTSNVDIDIHNIFALEQLEAMKSGEISVTSKTFEHSLSRYIAMTSKSLLCLKLDNISVWKQKDSIINATNYQQLFETDHLSALISYRPVLEREAKYDLCCISLMIFAIPWFLKLICIDVHSIIAPIERMVSFVTELASDPLVEIPPVNPAIVEAAAAAHAVVANSTASIENPFSEPLPLNVIQFSKLHGIHRLLKKQDTTAVFELSSLVVESTLQKLVNLLQLSFGSAGAQIIAKNIQGDYLDPIIPGKRTTAIFAFIAFPQDTFEYLCEHLGEEMMRMVNEVSAVVHALCHQHEGEINKNNGNSMLVVWKLRDFDAKKDSRRQSLPSSLLPKKKIDGMSDIPTESSSVATTENPKNLAMFDQDVSSIKINSLSIDLLPNAPHFSPHPSPESSPPVTPKKYTPENSFNNSMTHNEFPIVDKEEVISNGNLPNSKNRERSNSNSSSNKEEYQTILSSVDGSSMFLPNTKTSPPPCLSAQYNQYKAQQSLIAFLLTQLQLELNPALQMWRYHPRLNKKNGGTKPFTLAYGLHPGWAIEGAIGSCYKIDPSYLSPNVNIASRLLSLTKYYRVPIIFSSAFHLLLHEQVRARCRCIDRVVVKGSRKPIRIYTLDVNITQTHPPTKMTDDCTKNDSEYPQDDTTSKELIRLQIAWKLLNGEEIPPDLVRYLNNPDTEKEISSVGSKLSTGLLPSHFSSLRRSVSLSHIDEIARPSHLELISTLDHLQGPIPPSFLSLYQAALSSYLDGDWRTAGRLLVRCLQLLPTDPPSQQLMRYMAKQAFRAPKGWKGFRVMDRK